MEETILKRLDQIQKLTLLSAKKMLNMDDVAMLTGLSKNYVYRLTCTHALPFYKPNGKQIYFDREDIEAWMRSNRVDSVAESESAASAYCLAH